MITHISQQYNIAVNQKAFDEDLSQTFEHNLKVKKKI